MCVCANAYNALWPRQTLLRDTPSSDSFRLAIFTAGDDDDIPTAARRWRRSLYFYYPLLYYDSARIRRGEIEIPGNSLVTYTKTERKKIDIFIICGRRCLFFPRNSSSGPRGFPGHDGVSTNDNHCCRRYCTIIYTVKIFEIKTPASFLEWVL